MSERKSLPPDTEHLKDNIRRMNEEISALKSQLSMYKDQEKDAYQAILEDLPDFICRFSPDGIISYANPAYCGFVNKSSDDIKGSSIFSYIPKDERDQLRNYLDSLSKDCPVRTIDYCAITPDGHERWLQWTLRALFDEDHAVMEYLCAGRDISTLKHVENGLIDALEKYSTIFESSNDAILLQDGDCIFD